VAGRSAQGQSVQGVKERLSIERLVAVPLFFAAIALVPRLVAHVPRALDQMSERLRTRRVTVPEQ